MSGVDPRRLTARDLAQRWHDEQVDVDDRHAAEHSSCWCCCGCCDPDWPPGPGNPYWADAQRA